MKPSLMISDVWRWADPEGQQRCVRLDELRAALAGGIVAPNAPVWRAGWSTWQPAHEVPELQSSALAAANGVVPNIPPPPLAMVAVQQAFEATADQAFAHGTVVEHGLAGETPPPPPRYFPAAVKASPATVPPPSSRRGVGAPPSSAPRSLRDNGPPSSVPSSPFQERQQPSVLATTVGVPSPLMGAPPPSSQPSELPVLSSLSPLIADPLPVRPAELQISSNLPTTLGLPPPPALAAAAPPQKLPGTGLSVDPSWGSADGLPASTVPLLRADSMSDERETPSSVRGLRFASILDDFASVKEGRAPKNKIRLGVVTFLALMALLSVIALVVSAVRGKPSELSSATEPPLPSASPPASTGSIVAAAVALPPADLTARPAVSAATSESPPVADEKVAACELLGSARVVSRRVFVPSGVEAMAPAGSIALGFAVDPHSGVAVTVDPVSVGITATVKVRTAASALRINPAFEKGRLVLLPDVDKKDDKIRGRRAVATMPSIDVGVANGTIVAVPHAKSAPTTTLFPLEGDATVDALRALALPAKNAVALAFRRENAIFVGVAAGQELLVPSGPLVRLGSLGQVGAPSLTVSGDTIVVAWSDRATAQDPWQVRWTKLKTDGAADEPHAFVLPSGGLGGQAMSPSVAGLGTGRFVMAWSEGTATRQVRAQTFNADGKPSGAPLTFSAPGTNAGQPQVAVGADGRGVVAFLAGAGKSYEVLASPLSCSGK